VFDALAPDALANALERPFVDRLLRLLGGRSGLLLVARSGSEGGAAGMATKEEPAPNVGRRWLSPAGRVNRLQALVARPLARASVSRADHSQP
jgi:hypothetical protein